jgi:serine O-acetyltransferase
METLLTKEKILQQLFRQLESFFFVEDDEKAQIIENYEHIMDRCEINFEANSNKYFKRNNVSFFNPFISSQYLVFLYYYSNSIYHNITTRNNIQPDFSLCDKLYYLNKIMHSVDILYAVELPNCFIVEHPVGSVMGKAKYGNHFMFYQNCTVGGFHNKDTSISYPQIGNNVTMYANTMIIGDCIVGDNVQIGANACIKNQNIQSNSIVFGSSPNLIIKSI